MKTTLLSTTIPKQKKRAKKPKPAAVTNPVVADALAAKEALVALSPKVALVVLAPKEALVALSPKVALVVLAPNEALVVLPNEKVNK